MNYIFKYNVELDGDFFQKDCFSSTNKWLPFCLNGDLNKVIGKAKLASDDIGCYIEEYEFKDPNFQLPNRVGFGLITKQYKQENNKRYIEKCGIFNVMNYEPI